MSDTAGTLIGGTLMIAAMVFAIVLSVYWLVLPLIIVSKFNKLIDHANEANGQLAVISHQLTVQNLPPPPPVVVHESPPPMATEMATPE